MICKRVQEFNEELGLAGGKVALDCPARMTRVKNLAEAKDSLSEVDLEDLPEGGRQEAFTALVRSVREWPWLCAAHVPSHRSEQWQDWMRVIRYCIDRRQQKEAVLVDAHNASGETRRNEACCVTTYTWSIA